jgi:hypothetical protein
MKSKQFAIWGLLLFCACACGESRSNDEANAGHASSSPIEARTSITTTGNVVPEGTAVLVFVLHESHQILGLEPSSNSIGDECPKDTQPCYAPKTKTVSCCTQGEVCFTCDGTCRPKGSVHRQC